MATILITDPTLRDGSHAIGHRLTKAQIAAYAEMAEHAGVSIIEVGHGNGIGASSLQVGESLLSDSEMIRAAKEKTSRTRIAVLDLPSFATINKDLQPAIDLGVEVFKVAAHCTEADITRRHIEYLRGKEKVVYGNLMMTHMASKETLLSECRKLESYGAQGVILMDSAGAFIPADVTEKVSHIASGLTVPLGFHAHNNLGLAIANSIAAVEAGAWILDGTICGFGAGAGNAQLEVLSAVLEKMGHLTGIDLYKILDAAEYARKEILENVPFAGPIGIISGLAGVFSGFSRHVEIAAAEFNLDPRDIFFELGRRKVIAGQEDFILEVAYRMAKVRKFVSGQ